jgi:hypothetical protein
MAYSSITKPEDYFNTKLYTGNGTTNHAITGVGFQPDLNWIKKRSTTDNHILHYVGLNAGDYLVTNSTQELSNSGEMTKSLDSDGFTVGTRGEVNTNNSTFVSWNWLAGGTASSNTDGSITSSVSANTTSGFSIVSYTGTGANATVGHGLGVAPKMIIIKNRSATDDWAVYHGSLATDKYLRLNQTTAQETGTPMWNDTAPTSSVFSLGSYHNSNGPSENMIAYCFAEKKGYSKFGSYIGSGTADGTFVYTGFRPAFILAKRTDAVDNWVMYDNRRSGYNPQNDRLYPNGNFAEEGTTDKMFDMLSNGFKARATWTTINASGGNYIYMAFAEHPLVVNVNGGLPATAR